MASSFDAKSLPPLYKVALQEEEEQQSTAITCPNGEVIYP